MTAFNVYVTPNAAHIFSDGAHFDRSHDMAIIGFGSKVVPLMPYPAAVGATGKAFIPNLIGTALADIKFASFDDMLSGFPDVVQAFIHHAKAHVGDWGTFRAGLVGWSPAEDRPMLSIIESDGTTVAAPTQLEQYFDPPIQGTFNLNTNNPAETGLKLLEQQRLLRGRERGSASDRTFHGVGGFAQHTIITKDSIEMRVLKTWPEDKIGQHIMPERAG
ncbi:hypothetical protein [Bradyrhizobium sp. CCBAU 51627]|uniref:hypothetical protein n=1 Tax=Bradyrhizobium sp. CCBAU 51627 TaxID=1325088 RepID=UPI002305D1C4|nr:hypothetical protein [Bradyrhizobium sp. CCBAU 51627]MDA9437238.1 hypothetical protein [Bradyrhizobium sp. CCBAU 51627]